MSKWALDDLDLSTLLKALEQGSKYLPSNRYQEMTLQIFHRSYITPTRGYKMGILAAFAVERALRTCITVYGNAH